jgi:hypothetical protein
MYTITLVFSCRKILLYGLAVWNITEPQPSEEQQKRNVLTSNL